MLLILSENYFRVVYSETILKIQAIIVQNDSKYNTDIYDVIKKWGTGPNLSCIGHCIVLKTDQGVDRNRINLYLFLNG